MAPLPLAGLYESHLPVDDMEAALVFYTEQLGLIVGHRDQEARGPRWPTCR